MSNSGPMFSPSEWVKRRTTRSSSVSEKERGVHRHATLGAAERESEQRALEGHPRGEGPDLVEVDGGMEADTALVGAEHVVVLDAVALEDLVVAAVALDGEV